MTKPTAKNLLITGPPGCGKTTATRKVIDALSDLRLRGFVSQEMRKDGRRIGFELVGLGGFRATLAHVDFDSEIRVSRYGVDVDVLGLLVEAEMPLLPDETDLYVIDEIGKIECFSEAFIQAMTDLLDSPVPVLATIAVRGRGFIEEVKQRPDIELIEVTNDNRDDLPAKIVERIRDLLPG